LLLCFALAGDAGHVSAAGILYAQSGRDVHQPFWWWQQCRSSQESQASYKETW